MPIAGQLTPKGQRTRERIVEAAAGPAHHRLRRLTANVHEQRTRRGREAEVRSLTPGRNCYAETALSARPVRRDRAEALPSAVASQVAKLATWASAMSSATSSGAGLR